MNAELLKRPSAFVPVAMSVTALFIVLGYAVVFGVARQADEGTAAHMWQLLMAGQVPIIAFFASSGFLPNRNGLPWSLPYKSAWLSPRCSLCGGFAGDCLVAGARRSVASVRS
jgi:hypothetical protein